MELIAVPLHLRSTTEILPFKIYFRSISLSSQANAKRCRQPCRSHDAMKLCSEEVAVLANKSPNPETWKSFSVLQSSRTLISWGVRLYSSCSEIVLSKSFYSRDFLECNSAGTWDHKKEIETACYWWVVHCNGQLRPCWWCVRRGLCLNSKSQSCKYVCVSKVVYSVKYTNRTVMCV